MIFLISTVIGIIFVFAQNSLVPTVSIHGVYVDIVLLLIVFYSLRRSAFEAVFLGGLLGFFTDLFTPSYAGSFMLGYALAAFILVNGRESFNLDRPLLHGVAIFFVAILQRLIFLLFTGFHADGILIYILTSIFTALFTAIVAVGLDILIRIVFGKVEISSNE